MVTYELNAVLRAGASLFGATAASLGVADEFHMLMREIVTYLDADRDEEFGLTRVSPRTRVALAHEFRGLVAVAGLCRPPRLG
ncbi:hypothetical protein [Sanguibacter sp. HDW7]|uniref:hypothetical protein n=1 Tax=Sanguibacter sp. HDW7 TaxID=2714931 RepID=UPI00140B5640|nr:hypothetical protein [Sanguibacter sp. HDW7]QIK82869.1 hypothetical protein G7063_03940 [Sanguibacter sp. HDW7]